jgi:transcriptional regulator with XRE-family HTH domain
MPRTQKKRLPEGPFYRDLGRNIRLTRIAAGKSQEDAAEHLDVSFQQFQKYENGTNRIPIDKLLGVAAFLQVSLSQFVNDDGSTPKSPFHALMNQYTSKEYQSLLKHFSSIDDHDVRAAVLDFVKAMGDLKR